MFNKNDEWKELAYRFIELYFNSLDTEHLIKNGVNRIERYDYYYRVKCDSDFEHKLDWWEDTENEAIAVWNMRA